MKKKLYNKYMIISVISLAVIVIDQICKRLIVHFLEPGQSYYLIKHYLYLTHVQNTGAGFGLFQGYQGLLIWFSFIVLGLIVYYLPDIPNKRKWNVLIGLLIGGAVGNLIDRVAYGFVIDFIDIRIWPVFNIADSVVSISIILIIVYLYILDKKK